MKKRIDPHLQFYKFFIKLCVNYESLVVNTKNILHQKILRLLITLSNLRNLFKGNDVLGIIFYFSLASSSIYRHHWNPRRNDTEFTISNNFLARKERQIICSNDEILFRTNDLFVPRPSTPQYSSNIIMNSVKTSFFK